MKIDKATPRDFSSILNLLNKNDLPIEDVEEHINSILVAKENGLVVGCIAMEIYPRVGLLRSLAVHENRRGNGYGSRLTKALFALAKNEKIEYLYLLTINASQFFEKFGFVSIIRTEADGFIKNTNEFKHLCPESAVVMKMRLD